MKVTQTTTFLATALFFGNTSANKNIRGTTAFERMLQDDLGTQCSLNPVCAAMGLEGACCPSADGVMLDCCETRSCDAQAACEGLAGSCCPTTDGVELECCDHTEALAELLHGDKCAAHANCAALGLEDACCPTADGIFLDCCDPN